MPTGPCLTGKSFAVVSIPVDKVVAGGVADAVTILLATEVAAEAIAKEHVVLAVGTKDIGAGLCLIGLNPAHVVAEEA